MGADPTSPLPVACSLTPSQVRERRAALLPGLASRATEITRLAEGYRITFAADAVVLSAITAAIDAERLCCPFLTFDLHVPAGGAAIVLTLTGPDGTRAFLDALLTA